MNDDTTKRCCKCKQFKPRTREYFSPRPANSDGLEGRCKECEKLRRRKERAEHPDRHKRSQKKYRVQQGEQWAQRAADWRERNPDKVEAYRVRYYTENAEYYRKYSRDYHWRNRKHTLERMRHWRKNNPDKDKAKSMRYRARKLGAPGAFTAEDRKTLYQSQKGLCWWCGKPLGEKVHLDHRIPLSRGGTNDARNIVLTHPFCNISKKDKMPWEWSDRLL